MASNYHSYQPERKISAGDGPKLKKQGGAASMPQKQSYTGCKLPGKASNGFAAMKKGVREINGYAAYNGLSQSSGGGNSSFSTADEVKNDYRKRDAAQSKVDEYRTQEEAGSIIVNNARRNSSSGYKADMGGLGRTSETIDSLQERRKKR